MYKLGSLFDGSGGFPLAGSLCGITPIWASEVEPYPIAVTRSRFPEMRHLGDISRINGWTVEPVDVITFGSPCQDLSIAGKRAGLKHEANGDEETTRSGLFMEAVRIIKEMRKATNGEYPKYALWENVPGAFSSNKGEDFRIVLEELIKICEPTAVMPAVPAGGWPDADLYCGDGWSLAYRTFDAQYWGVPQRRRRIHLVLDLRGRRAGEISFEREGLRGYFAQGGSPWQAAPGDAGDGTAAADRSLSQTGLDDQGGSQISVRTDGKSPTLRAEMRGNVPCVMEAAGFKAGQGAQARSIGYEPEKCPTLAAEAGGNSVPSICAKVYDARGNGDDQTASTLTGDHENRITDYTSVLCMATQQGGAEITNNKCPTITAAAGMSGNNQPVICMAHGQANAEICEGMSPTLNCNHEQPIVFDKEVYNSGANAAGGHYIAENGPCPTLRTKHAPGVCTNYIVRRLTPTECARLQGFPDLWGHIDPKKDFTDEEYAFWTDVRMTHAVINGKEPKTYRRDQMLTWYNKLHTDSAEYKMWGNGIALPPALYVMQGIVDALEEDPI